MKILILEDETNKFLSVDKLIKDSVKLCSPSVQRASNFMEFVQHSERTKFDLLIIDLLIPMRANEDATDQAYQIVTQLAGLECTNYGVPTVALTRYDSAAEGNFKFLNQKGITIVTYDESDEAWKESLVKIIIDCTPLIKYDFAVVCALRKERDAFDEIGFEVGNEVIIEDLSCKEVEIGSKRGLLVIPTRMGLVSSAIACTKVIERFKPKLITMSGICAGIKTESNIYDIVIPEVCYQHDSGKWTDQGFIHEPFHIALENGLRLKLESIINSLGFNESLTDDINPIETELPQGMDKLSCRTRIAPSSSGSAVVGRKAMAKTISQMHRKAASFEMESYALYESAYASYQKPLYFSAKCVVDNGDEEKSNQYQRIACLLSASAVATIIARLEFT